MTAFGLVAILLLSWAYDQLSHKTIIDSELKNIQNISEELSSHLNSHLKEHASNGLMLSSVPLIHDALVKSNSEFVVLTDEERAQEVINLNQQWREATDINDPFIQSHLTNHVATFLKSQQTLMPGRYGEIFLTNRYGVMIATTGKLTTLAHGHKYWWQAAYDDERGRTFLDDRGFDASVEGYVLGVVVPVKHNNEIIGMLKSNVNIIGPLTDIIEDFNLRHPGKLQIVRTGGLIVAEYGVTPLSTQINDSLVELLQKKQGGTTIVAEDDVKQLTAFSSIKITLGSDKIGFGGKKESIDHLKGNKGEAWNIVVSLAEEKAIDASHNITLIVIGVGIIFTLLTAIVALLLGRLVARPIVKLAATAQVLGDGYLDVRAGAHSNDEIGSLANSLNIMAENFQRTVISRDELIDNLGKAKEAAEIANKAKGLFIANMSHQFRTPLNAVLGFSQLLLNDKTVADKQREYLKNIYNSGQLQLSLVNDVLAMSRLEDGQTSLQLQVIDISHLLEDLIDNSKAAAKEKKINFNVEYRSSIPQYISCDPQKLQLLLGNVIDNAIKYTESGGVVLHIESVQTESDNTVQLIFDIEDSGIGIVDKYQKHIFMPFFKIGDQSDKTGTGMGLTLAQRFLALMGGEISVESEVKKGTIFHITLPVEQVTEALFDSNRKKKLASLGQSDQDEDEDITADDLAVISDVLLAQLLDAVDALDTENSVALAELIEKKTPVIGKGLLTMINNFDFEKLQRLLSSYQAK